MTYGFGKASFVSPATDAFGRLRASFPVSQFEAKFTYGVEEKFYNTTTTTGGSATFLQNEAAWDLAVTTQNNARVLRQSAEYLRYYPGKSQLIQMTGIIGAPHQNRVKRIGYYDDNDGLFFSQIGTEGFAVVRRTSVSGVPVDNPVIQANWNIDKMDGTGPSGVVFDPTKTQIFVIDFQWLGVGAVRFGLVVDGAIWYVHQMNHANILDAVYMKSAWLPLRYEIVNTGTTTVAGSMKQICSAVSSEGGAEPTGILRSISNIASVSFGSADWVPVLSIRVNETLNSLPFRGVIQISGIDTLTTGVTAAQFAVFENPTLATPSWVPISASSPVNCDITATTITGGSQKMTMFNARTSSNSQVGQNELRGGAGTIFTVAARSIGGNSAGNVSINWREII